MMSPSKDSRPYNAARLTVRYCRSSIAKCRVIAIFPNDEIEIGRENVEEAFNIKDRTISKHHLRLRCLVYEDDEETLVSPMVYLRVLSSNPVRISQIGDTTSESDRLITKTDGDVLLNHGDRLYLTAHISALLQHNFLADEVAELNTIQQAETRRFSDTYRVFNRTIGWGGQTTVYLASERSTDRQLACKVVRGPDTPLERHITADEHNQEVQRVERQTKRHRELIERAVHVLKDLSHPNIISLEKAIFTSNNIYIFEELITGGDLFSYFKQHEGGLQEPETAVIVRQVLKAVDYLHDSGIAHRDIKPENILMTSWREGTRVVLTDFGQSRFISDASAASKGGISHRMHTAVGTCGYAAPEVFLKPTGDKESSGYSKAVDIWSIGCLTATLLTGHVLFPDEDRDITHSEIDEQLAEMVYDQSFIYNGSAWSHVGRKAKSFVSGCVMLDERQRLTAKQALMHPWFTNKHYAAEMEAAYQRAIQEWRPKPKCSPLIEHVDVPEARIASNHSARPTSIVQEVKSRYFEDPQQIVPAGSFVPRMTARDMHQYHKMSPLPSVTQDAEMELDCDEAALPAQTQNSVLHAAQAHTSVDRLTGVENDIREHFSIQDFAPPKSQFTMTCGNSELYSIQNGGMSLPPAPESVFPTQ